MKLYDYSGNELEIGVEIDTTFTLNGYAADAKATGDALEQAGMHIEIGI